jgi:hypothetical protein
MNKGASQFSRQSIATTGLISLDFGFLASEIEVRNDGTGTCFISFRGGSTGAMGTTAQIATTNDYPLSSGEITTLGSLLTAGMSIAATSTANAVRVLAVG